MTKQEIFDKVLAHLRKQGKAAYDGIGCRYRTEDGLMCAVGCLIPDDKYNPDIEGLGVSSSVISVLPFSVNKDMRQYLIELQGAHDCVLREKGIAPWENDMARIARVNGLVYTPPASV